MTEKLEKLIVALTDLAVQATAYFAKQNGVTPGQAISREAGETKEEAPRKTRAKKTTEVEAAPAGAQEAPAAPSAPEMTDEESYKELCRLVAGFMASGTAGAEERRAFAVKYVADTYKVDALNKVPHGPQRMQLIQWVKDQLVKKNAAVTVAAPSGFGV